MTRSDLEAALKENKKRQREVGSPDLEDLEDKRRELMSEAEHLRDEAQRLEAEAEQIQEQIARGDYGMSEDEKEEMRALKDEARRIRKAMNNANGRVKAVN